MSTKLVSGTQLRELGWTETERRSVLDEPDECGPSQHWLNVHGQPLYHERRVAVASYRIGRTDRRPDAKTWREWRESEKPTSKPLYTVSFRRIVQLLKPEYLQDISLLRISHPQMGRLPGTREHEQALKREVLTLLVERVSETANLSWEATVRALHDRAAAIVISSGPYPTSKVAIRPICVSGYASQAVGHKALARALDFLSLVHGGYILAYDQQPRELLPLLVAWPSLRLDSAEMDSASLPPANLGF